MSNRRNVRQEKKAFVTDSFANFISAVGHGTGNQHDGAGYGLHPVSRTRVLLENAYRGSWVAGRVIDIVANDMTREGSTVSSEDDPKRTAIFEKSVERLQIWKQFNRTIKWARLYGGAIAFMMIEGQDPATPLNLDSITKGQFKGLMPLDRWMLQPSLNDLVSEYGPHYGQPTFYETINSMGGLPSLKIHYSRVVRIEGVELPYNQKIAENLWGQSELERMWDRMTAFDSATSGIAQLVYKAHLRTVSVDGLREIIGGNKAAMKGLIQNIQMIRSMQTNEGLTLLDAKDKFETHQYAFGGLDAILIQFGDQLCGAVEIPRSRLFGESPGGLSNDDSTTRHYHETIKQKQVSSLSEGVETVYRLTYLSTFGAEPPHMFELDFKPLRQMTDVEKAGVTNTTTAAIAEAVDKNLLSRAGGMRELKALSRVVGTFSTITDDEINEADADPAPSAEALGLEIPKPTPVQGGEPGSKGEVTRPARKEASGSK